MTVDLLKREAGLLVGGRKREGETQREKKRSETEEFWVGRKEKIFLIFFFFVDEVRLFDVREIDFSHIPVCAQERCTVIVGDIRKYEDVCKKNKDRE